ncbi:RNA 2',3'-cyclic phosphodiesterase [Sneathiella chinensis]|uniref:RNA 2',3'-cyclic phosphodiesterase n=1 Tax=Sneathiella chinensis TaxID=349750 RepID=A0ABQ5U8G4_9PROT|nr:RNA 2',3'-cyclic phosphodiesterase [Sneathiella chinensis]GLQ07963.1 RNA 2',3'-cyclic phosphodiesterase [Sneathiella chinensis]
MRLFVALGLSDTVKQQVAALKRGVPEARWIPEDNDHVTLAFIGEVDSPRMMDIGLALGRIHHPAFELSIEGVGVFGSTRHPRVLWAGVKKNDSLSRLNRKIIKAVEEAGIKLEERSYRPHITLARVHNSPYERVRRFLTDQALFRIPPFQVDHFSLYSSHLAHTGAIYHEEMTFDLAPDPAADDTP